MREVDERLGREIRVKREPHKATLPRFGDVRDLAGGSALSRRRVHSRNPSSTLGDPDLTVGSPSNVPWRVESRHDGLDPEPLDVTRRWHRILGAGNAKDEHA